MGDSDGPGTMATRTRCENTGEAAPQGPCSVQERHRGPGACPEKISEAGEESGAQVLRGAAEGTGIVQSAEEEAREVV